MLITKLKLKNIKSFREAELNFQPGVCVIGGENGAGKSTVFEAIGYALFGLAAEKFIGKAENMVTLGAKSGEIEVHFTGSDGLEYFITRKVGKGKGGERRLFTADKFEITTALDHKLTELLGLSRERPLAEQFEEIIAPAQSDFLSPFNLAGAKREKEFEKMLGISAWRELYTQTSSLPTLAQAKIKSLREQSELLEPQVADIPELQQRLSAADLEWQSLNQQFAALSRELEQLKAREQQDEERRKAFEDNARQLSLAQQALTAEEQLRPQLEQDVHKTRAAAAILESKREAKADYDRLELELKALSEHRVRQQKLAKTRQELELEAKKLEARMETDKHYLSEQNQKLHADLAQARQLGAELEAQLKAEVGRETQAQTARDVSRNVCNRLAEFNLEPLSALRLTWENRNQDIKALDAEIEKLQQELRGKAELEAQLKVLPELEQQLKQLNLALSDVKAELVHLAEGKAALSQGICPFFKAACLNLEGKDAGSYFDAKTAGLAERKQELELKLQSRESELEHLKAIGQNLLQLQEKQRVLEERKAAREDKSRQLNGAWQKFSPQDLMRQWQINLPDLDYGALRTALESLPQDDTQATLATVEEIYRNFLEQQRATLQQELATREERLKALSNERSRIQSLAAARIEEAQKLSLELEKLDAQQAKVTESQAELLRLNRQSAELDKELVRYQDLEQQWESKLKARDALKPSYDEYLANAGLAAQLPESQERLETSLSKAASLQDRILQLQAQQQVLSREFSPAALDDLKLQVKTREQELSARSEALKYRNKELEQMRSSLSQKQELQAKIVKLQTQADEYARTLEFIDFIRNRILKQVANRIAEGFRANISDYARRIYHIIARKSEELFWDDNYALSLIDEAGGVTRKRSDQQLSAGQLMSAVIAMRLALLQATGARLAFFDEPTSNLDAQRRQNLVEAFQNIESEGKDWYNQLFLISHDTHFYEITSQHIELYLDKERGSLVQTAD